MKKIFVFIALLFLYNAASAQVSEQDMQIAAPGPQHENLKMLEGEWTSSIKYNMSPGQSMNGTGSSTNKMILGGRFLEIRSIGDVMGMRVEGLTIMGYDKTIGKYTLVGYDELGTYYVTAQGDYDEATKTFTLPGTYVEPMSKKNMGYKFVFNVANPNEVKFMVIFDIPEMGGDFTMVDGTYTKK